MQYTIIMGTSATIIDHLDPIDLPQPPVLYGDPSRSNTKDQRSKGRAGEDERQSKTSDRPVIP